MDRIVVGKRTAWTNNKLGLWNQTELSSSETTGSNSEWNLLDEKNDRMGFQKSHRWNYERNVMDEKRKECARRNVRAFFPVFFFFFFFNFGAEI
jgi:hypothetical protein